MDLTPVRCIWNHDVCKQFRRGRAAFLVLGYFWLAWVAGRETVGFSIVMRGLLIACRLNAGALSHSAEPWFAASLLVLLRVVRVWNQTGQKHTGEPDIACTILPAHHMLLWFFVLVTYLDVTQRLSRRAVPWASRRFATAASLALGIAAMGFKIAFTRGDTPELVPDLGYFLSAAPIEVASLIAQARAVFTSIAIMMVLTSFPAVYERIRGGQAMKGRA